MTSSPDVLWLVLLVLASARAVHFVLWDSLAGLAPDSGTRLSKRLDVWAYDADGSDRSWLRGKVGTGLTCPYCVGGWVTLAAVCGWSALWPWQLEARGLVVWLAVWAAQCVASKLDHRFLVD